ncbi:hypothetical protein ACN6MY_17925 [Peribacillus sp. B-H-3]|uniref:hypothetical protein n=1 Tax=Peribacillus sp. B-H-3 TaxID=3400420 RepID=UPI003B0251A9
MNDQQRNRFAELLQKQKQKSEKQKRHWLEAELLNIFDIRQDVFCLSKTEEELIMDEFVSAFPVTEWGRMDWKQIKNKCFIENGQTNLIMDVGGSRA